MFGQTMCAGQAAVRSDINLHRTGGCSVRQCALDRRMFGQTQICTEQAGVQSDNLHRAGGCLVNVHRAGGCSVRQCALSGHMFGQCALSRQVFGQTMCTEQADVRSAIVHFTLTLRP